MAEAAVPDSHETRPDGACLARRAWAKLTDVFLFTWLAIWLAHALAIWSIGPDAWNPELNSATTTGLAFDFYLVVCGPLLFLIGQVLMLRVCGATPGKLLWGVHVAGSADSRPGMWTCLKRTIVEFFSLAIVGVGYLRAWTSPDRLTWHDRRSATRVSRAPAGFSFRGTTWSRRWIGLGLAALMLAAGLASESLAPWAYLRLQPEVDRYIWAGIQAYSKGDYASALKAYDNAIAADPRSSLAYANRGAVYGDMGDLAKQIADCNRALQLDSTQVWALLGRANANRLRGVLSESSADYSRVIRLRPRWSGLVFAYLGRGSIRFREGNYAEAASDFGTGMSVANESYVGTSDYSKGRDFLEDMAKCELFRREALRRAGRSAEADSASGSARELVELLGSEREQKEIMRQWLSR